MANTKDVSKILKELKEGNKKLVKLSEKNEREITKKFNESMRRLSFLL